MQPGCAFAVLIAPSGFDGLSPCTTSVTLCLGLFFCFFVFCVTPDYHRIKSDIHVRVGALPVLDAIRDIRQTHLNALVKLQGVVTRRTGVFPQLKVQ